MASAERFALAVGDDDLAAKEDKIRSVEYVAALSGASNLGSDIFRAKDYDKFALRRAVLLLTKKAMAERGYPLHRAMAQAMSVCALHEILWQQCRTCKGAGVMIEGQLKIVCHTCEGSRIHRYTDIERQRLCGIKGAEWKKWEKRYLMVLALARSHDCAPLKAKERLG